jgi:hypothetical protein
MRKILSITALLATVLLAACGGSSASLTGGGTQTPATDTTTDPVTTVTVISSLAEIAADGSNSATISATAKDKNNNLVAGVTVSFAASAGDLAVTQAKTDTNGLATATLTAGAAATGTTITVTATTGGISGKATVTVGTAQQTISVITSLPQIPSDGTKPATITALVRNAQNQFVSGVAVVFTSTSGGLTVTQGTTDASGAATATLTSAGDQTNRTITVTATAGSESATVPVQVIGTTLTLTGPASLVQGSQGTYSVTLTDAGANGIANKVVTLTSAKGNTLSATSITTNASGQNTFVVTAVNGGTDTITASVLSLKATESVAVSTQKFAFTAPAAANSPVNIGATSTVKVVWTAAGVPQVGQTVTFSATRGTLSATTATIDSTGTASVNISSTTAGPSLISATGTGVSAQASIEFVATTPSAVAVQASPATIAAQGQSTITATVRDANDNLVEGQVVNFTITQDSTGGSLSVASATTNVQGQASTVYTASTATSATNGIVVSATVSGTSVTSTASLTVGGQSVNLSLGTGNVVGAGPNKDTQYSYPFSVQAIDAAGAGVDNVTVSFAVTSLAYAKGSQTYNSPPGEWQPNYSTAPTDPDAFLVKGFVGCLSEDVSGNGILTSGEDYNTNGKLDPGLVVSTDVGSATTANGGTASVNLIYPKDHAYWVVVKLTATATVSGNQSSTSTSFLLLGLATDYTSQTVIPPGEYSPYGTASTCLDPN